MRRNSWRVSLALVFAMVFSMLRPVLSAPMFPDVPDMWAKDAVAALAAKGILEGYPDGTFKGDRAATRYEVAMIVARLLAKMEQEHATFATKADLDELRKLVNQLKEELDALGVRVQNLEDNVAKLDKRVTELERITFYGSIDARFTSMTMGNRGTTIGTNGDQIFSPAPFGGGVQLAVPTFIGAPLVNPDGSRGSFFAATGVPPAAALATGVPTVFSTGVGIPMFFAPSTATATFFFAGGSTTFNIGGRPLAVNVFAPNTSSFNSDSTVPAPGNPGSPGFPVARNSYNLAVGANTTLGGNAANAAAFAVGGNPFTGLTGLPGVPFSTPLVIPTMEVRTGRPWTEGTGYSGQGILGVRIKLNEDMDAGAEFAAYWGSGDPIIDAFYGVSARRLSNPFASNQNLAGVDAGQGATNQPWTRMNIDNFWFLHKPSNIKVQIGAYGDTHMDSIVYQPEFNPNYYGPRYLDNFGFRVSGTHHFLAKFDWEVFGSNVASGNLLRSGLYPGATATGATDYLPLLFGADFKWTIGEEGNQGHIKFDVLRIWDGNSSGNATTVGSVVGVNGVWTDWANPAGFYAAQLNPTGITDANTNRLVAGIGSTSDARPIIPNVAGNPTAGFTPIFGTDQQSSGILGAATQPLLGLAGVNGNAALPVVAGAPTSSFGPQSMFTWGITGGWNYTFTDDVKFRFFGEYGHSDYKPSMNSSYIADDGRAFRVGVGLTLFHDFDLDGEYVNVNPFYNPYIMQYPTINGISQDYWRIPSLSWFPELYPVNDKDVYPNNREGFRVFLKWNPVDPKDGKHKTVFWGEYGNMQQETSSLQQVRFSPGNVVLGPTVSTSAPNGFVLGQMPGFIDTVFTGFSPSSFVSNAAVPAPADLSQTTPSVINQFATPLENPRGRVTNWGVGGDYRFDQLNGLAIHVGYKNWQFTRSSGLAPNFGGSENNINLNLAGGLVALSYPINERFSVKGGYAWTNIRGHYDPTGIYRNFALDTGSTSFQTFNNDQSAPFVGFDYDVARNVNWNMTAKFLDSHDNLGTFNSPNFYLARNPLSWSGLQVTSEVKVSF